MTHKQQEDTGEPLSEPLTRLRKPRTHLTDCYQTQTLSYEHDLPAMGDQQSHMESEHLPTLFQQRRKWITLMKPYHTSCQGSMNPMPIQDRKPPIDPESMEHTQGKSSGQVSSDGGEPPVVQPSNDNKSISLNHRTRRLGSH